MMLGHSWLVVVTGLLFAFVTMGAHAQGIFTCVDSKGRRLTSDRPIAECMDREQKEMSSTGTVRRVLKPQLTAEEAAAEEARARKAAEEKARIAEEGRRERALLSRYPNRAAHDRERAQAQIAVSDVIAAAVKRSAELQDQRKKLLAEADFYKNDKSKMPAQLKRQIEENDQNLAAQQRFVANQEQEKQRVNARFDEELVRLESLWAKQRAAGALPAPASTQASKP